MLRTRALNVVGGEVWRRRGEAVRYAIAHARGTVVWVEEVTVFLMIWMAFMGAAIGVRRGAHIAMSILVDRLPTRVARALFYASTLAIIAFSAVVAWQGTLLALSVGGQRSAALGVPMGIPYIIVPLGALLIILQACANVVDPPQPTTVGVD